jgi:hypothetical protein
MGLQVPGRRFMRTLACLCVAVAAWFCATTYQPNSFTGGFIDQQGDGSQASPAQ